MKWMRSILLLGLMTGSANFASAQEDAESADRDGWGFTAGHLTGLGIGYRRHFEGDLGFHVGGIGFGDRDSYHMNLGAQIMRDLRRSKNLRFYLLGGVGWSHSGDQHDDE